MFESILLGLVQGITEFLPVSSSGHLVIARAFLHLPLENSLTFDIFLNTATLLAVMYCFWGDIKRIFVDLFTEGWSSRSKNLVLSIILGTIPAVLVGFMYGDRIEQIFRSTHSVAWALIAGSVLMWLADRVHRAINNTTGVSLLKSIFIGFFQSLAFIPGISRSGATISGGLLSKLSREEAIRFAFLLYIPVSIGAALKAVFNVALNGSGSGLHGLLTLNSGIAFLIALFTSIWAIKFMLRYLSRNSFTPFIIYRIIIAILILILL